MKFALLHSNLNYLFFVDNNSLTITRDVSKRRINIYFLLFVCWFFLHTVQAISVSNDVKGCLMIVVIFRQY